MSNSTVGLPLRTLISASLLLVCACSKPPAYHGQTPLQFDISNGNVRNYFLQQGPVAGHMLTTSGLAPRVVWGFPAENTGIGIWFDTPAKATQIEADADLSPVDQGHGMLGVTTSLTSDASQLRVKKAVFGNVRTVRDYFYGATIIPEFDPSFQQNGSTLVLQQNCLDGQHHIRLELELLKGTTGGMDGSQLVFHAGSDGKIHLRATATTDYAPLTPVPQDKLVTSAAANNPTALNALAFLTYKEKMLAGSWRFLTYFGRDTMLSLRMLLPVLQPEVTEAGLGGVIDRLNSSGTTNQPYIFNADGTVAHEEALGDYAWFVRVNQKLQPPTGGDMFTPWLDYKMVDGDFLLPAVLNAYATSDAGKSRITAFLARVTPSGETYQNAIKRNINLLISRTTAFANNPQDFHNLIHIKDGQIVGNWRDSGSGLGGGSYPYDINVALAPAALRGAASLYAAGLLGSDNQSATLNGIAAVWEANSTQYFQITVSQSTAQRRVQDYASKVADDNGVTGNLDATDAVASISGPITYRAVSLDKAGRPIPIMNSDDGFVMLFTNPQDDLLQEIAGRIIRPFPAGLRTDSGIVVANPALAPPDALYVPADGSASSSLVSTFTRGDYHGTVIWSWQQAMLAAGFARQLARKDLQPATLQQLGAAQTALWQVIKANASNNAGELWSWQPVNGKAVYDSFAGAAVSLNRFVDESNAIQLWSTVYLAVQPPAGM